jgi:hypothetical protein
MRSEAPWSNQPRTTVVDDLSMSLGLQGSILTISAEIWVDPRSQSWLQVLVGDSKSDQAEWCYENLAALEWVASLAAPRVRDRYAQILVHTPASGDSWLTREIP